MKREVLKNLGLTDEVIEKIMTEYGTSVTSLKNKQTELEEQIGEYKKQLTERDKQLDSLNKTAGDSEALKQQIAELQAANKQTADAYEAKLKEMAKDNAVNLALTKSGAKNPKAVKALLNLENAKMDGDAVVGLEEQLAKLKQDEAYLFHVEQKPNIAGTHPNSGSGAPANTPPPGSYAAFAAAYPTQS